MYIALIDFPILEADRPRVLAELAADAAAARDVDGNLGFRIFTDAEEPEVVSVLHRWRDKAAFERYLASDAFARVGAAVRPLMAGAPVSLRMRAEEDKPVSG